MTETSLRPLRVFLCHALADKPSAYRLYRHLRAKGMDPWLDAEKLMPGQKWQVEIPKALDASDAIVVILSKNSVTKEGFVQAEIKFALDKALEMPEGRIFLIPARLEECEVPDRLRGYQWVDLFKRNWSQRLTSSLNERARQLGITIPPVSELEKDHAPNTIVSPDEDGDNSISYQVPSQMERAAKNSSKSYSSRPRVAQSRPISALLTFPVIFGLLVLLLCGIALNWLLTNSAQPDVPITTPEPNSIQPGTYVVGSEIEAGIYRGLAGEGFSNSCHWERLRDLQQQPTSVLAEDRAYGQYYVEVRESDYALKTDCKMIRLDTIADHIGDYPQIIAPGMYLVGSDIRPGTYRGQSGNADSCYWARLQSVTGAFDAILANDNSKGRFYVQVSPSDFAFETRCELEWVEQ